MGFKFRSWMLIVVGIFVQLIFSLIFYINLRSIHSTNLGGVFAAIGLATLVVLSFVSSLLAIIPLIFIIPRKTIIAGGILSLIFAIICFIIRVAIPLGVFLFIAGIIALWKKI